MSDLRLEFDDGGNVTPADRGAASAAAPEHDPAPGGLEGHLDALRRLEGFPAGSDEAILNASLPPRYTACPNPFIPEHVGGEDRCPEHDPGPFAADVSEGRGDPIYQAQIYHTKVPPRAIAHYIEHFAPPGGLVFDGFCGSGMTGVAASMTGRRALLVDLSPAATAIAATYNIPVAPTSARDGFAHVLARLREQCGWLYAPTGEPEREHVIWSEVYRCPHCGAQSPFSRMGFDFARRKPAERIACPECGRELQPPELERVLDDSGQTVELPVRVALSSRGGETGPTPGDLALLAEIAAAPMPHWFPDSWMMHRPPDGDGWGDMWRRGYHTGVTRVADFYTKRTLWALSAALHFAGELEAAPEVLHLVRHTIINASLNLTRMRRAYQGPVPLVLYFPRLRRECNVIRALDRRFKRAADVCGLLPPGDVMISTQSSTSLPNIPDDCVDYIFTDPPFGQNIIYSEVNFLWESWLGVTTAQGAEAIISGRQRKGIEQYGELMRECFSEFRRVLKPGRWMTVEFHNSSNDVWWAIQQALEEAGFRVEDVRVLDKQQVSFKQASTENAVQRDLAISARKLECNAASRPASEGGGEAEVWEFVALRLQEARGPEREPRALFGRVVQHWLRQGWRLPMDAARFYAELAQRYELGREP